jgi:hypothetical protein
MLEVAEEDAMMLVQEELVVLEEAVMVEIMPHHPEELVQDLLIQEAVVAEPEVKMVLLLDMEQMVVQESL